MEKTIGWFVPGLLKGSGGHRTIFKHAEFLEKSGYKCKMFIESQAPFSNVVDSRLTQRVGEYYGCSNLEIYEGFPDNYKLDLAFATVWYTARKVHSLSPMTKKAYFVQDYEPFFYPVGDIYLHARMSYRFGLVPITIGRWLSYKLQREQQQTPRYFDFCADQKVYRPLMDMERENAVCAIFQPDKPRRCSEIVRETLGLLKQKYPEVSIYTYGSDCMPGFSFPHTHLGIISVEECNKLYNRCRAGLCISSTNPSRLPFEMMAAGLPVVDVCDENTIFDFPDVGMVLANGDPASLAAALEILLLDPEQHSVHREGGMRFMNDRPFEEEYLQFKQHVDELFLTEKSRFEVPEPLYRRDPIIADLNSYGQFDSVSRGPSRLKRLLKRIREKI